MPKINRERKYKYQISMMELFSEKKLSVFSSLHFCREASSQRSGSVLSMPLNPALSVRSS